MFIMSGMLALCPFNVWFVFVTQSMTLSWLSCTDPPLYVHSYSFLVRCKHVLWGPTPNLLQERIIKKVIQPSMLTQSIYIHEQWWSLGLIIRDRDLIIRDRDQDLTIRDWDHPFRDRERDRDPMFFLSNICLHENIIFFHWEYFSTQKHNLFTGGYWNLPPTECFSCLYLKKNPLQVLWCQ